MIVDNQGLATEAQACDVGIRRLRGRLCSLVAAGAPDLRPIYARVLSELDDASSSLEEAGLLLMACHGYSVVEEAETLGVG